MNRPPIAALGAVLLNADVTSRGWCELDRRDCVTGTSRECVTKIARIVRREYGVAARPVVRRTCRVKNNAVKGLHRTEIDLEVLA